MNIVKIIGGLGNQMFQYAFYLSLQKRKIKSKIDITSYDNYNLHNGFELSKVFNLGSIEFTIASINEVSELKDSSPFFKYRKIAGNLFFNSPNKFIKKNHFVEKNFSIYDSDVYKKSNFYLEGYWQNEKYFNSNRSEILKSFSWKNISKRNCELSKKMSQQESVSIHIRKLDQPKSLKQYLFRLRLMVVWRTCNKKYYLDAIDEIKKRTQIPHFYIFTDNIKWVRRNIPLSSNIEIVDWNRGKDSYQDMYLMTSCKHNIISMSSFSWWGAWLNNNQSKIVIAPKKWATRFVKNIQIIPSSWIKI